jgi:hypothetical protein
LAVLARLGFPIIRKAEVTARTLSYEDDVRTSTLYQIFVLKALFDTQAHATREEATSNAGRTTLSHSSQWSMIDSDVAKEFLAEFSMLATAKLTASGPCASKNSSKASR